MGNTRDLMDFGYRELDQAGDLLKALKSDKNKTEQLNNNVAIEFNPNSGNVFLVDEDCNVAMMNGENLEDWYYCFECGYEGFKDELSANCNTCCMVTIREELNN